MKKHEIWQLIELELRKAKKKFPNWPDHPAAKAGIVCEESGELMKACLEWKYERANTSIDQLLQVQKMKHEAIQTAVTAIRFLENLPESNNEFPENTIEFNEQSPNGDL